VHAVRSLDCPRTVRKSPARLRAVIRGYGHEPKGPLAHPAELLDLRERQLPWDSCCLHHKIDARLRQGSVARGDPIRGIDSRVGGTPAVASIVAQLLPS